MQLKPGKICGTRDVLSLLKTTPVAANEGAYQEHSALAQLDVGLFRALLRLGTPKQRICSALWLSYAEYDEYSKLI